MLKSEWEEIKDQTLKPGEWTLVYLDDEDAFFRRRWYCGDCKTWTTHGATPYCPYCGKKKEVYDNV